MTKTVSAGVGLVAYPGQGIAKSLHSLMHSSTTKKIVEARRMEGKQSAEQLSELERLRVVDLYHDLQSRK